MRRVNVVMALLLVGALAGCAADTGIEITDARIGQPTGPNAAMYFTAASNGGSDRLMSASTEAAASVEFHESIMNDDGTIGMRPVSALELPAGGSLVIEPGGYHLMLIDAERMKIGDEVEVTLVWENAGEMIVTTEVVDPADTMSHDH